MAQTFGLFSIHERMQLLGGAVEIESAPNAGTSVSLIIPLENGNPAQGRNQDSERAGKTDSTPVATRKVSEKIRVMVVDDHPVMRDGLIRMMGSHADLEVVGEARGGEEAVVIALKVVPDATQPSGP